MAWPFEQTRNLKIVATAAGTLLQFISYVGKESAGINNIIIIIIIIINDILPFVRDNDGALGHERVR